MISSLPLKIRLRQIKDYNYSEEAEVTTIASNASPTNATGKNIILEKQQKQDIHRRSTPGKWLKYNTQKFV